MSDNIKPLAVQPQQVVELMKVELRCLTRLLDAKGESLMFDPHDYGAEAKTRIEELNRLLLFLMGFRHE